MVRREFRLPEQDEEFLETLDRPWETIIEQGGRWVMIHDLPVPPGYNVDRVMAAIKIESAYPPGQLDMVYFFPPLVRQDGKPVRAILEHQIEDKKFQRWSRHYPWNPVKDSLTTHFLRIEQWLEGELNKR